MSVGAWIMLAVGAVFLWGGLIVAIVNYLRIARRGNDGGNGGGDDAG
ncbi:MAG: MetS family NSS transporter small subunit [Actinomycetota bacterium]|nr:MetS family NSS transporter small subunit [Actinomycetota bacterium]